MKKLTVFHVSLVFCFISLLTSCGTSTIELIGTDESVVIKENRIVEKASIPVRSMKEISISSIGDVLIHQPVYIDAWTGSGYNFTPMLEKVKPYLSAATITIANQESMIGGEEFGLSSYPTFNSPVEIGAALKEVGVNAVNLANNHTLDRGEAVIQQAIRHWEQLGITYVGAYKDEEDCQDLRIIETDEGISVALLAYTYGTNGIPVPKGKDYLVNIIDKANMEEEIARAKEAADVIIMSLHFGNEYERLPNDFQKSLVQFAADQGVHAVIGHHPHVLQPADWIEGEEGNETLVIYSLGNFLSNQQTLYQRIGGIFTFTVKKTTFGDKEEIEIHSPTLLPTYVKFRSNWSDYEVVPMYTLSNEELAGASNHYSEIKKHMSQWMPELQFLEGE